MYVEQYVQRNLANAITIHLNTQPATKTNAKTTGLVPANTTENSTHTSHSDTPTTADYRLSSF